MAKKKDAGNKGIAKAHSAYLGPPEERGTDEALHSRHLSKKEFKKYTKKRVQMLLKLSDENERLVTLLRKARHVPYLRTDT